MNFACKMVVGCSLFLRAASASALNCERATSPAQKTICRDASLTRADSDLNEAYQRLVHSLTPKARSEVVTQQRAWLSERDRVCTSGDPNCLRKQYGNRLDQLAALNAASEAADGQLTSLNPLVVTGTWKATAVQDPDRAGKTKDSDVRDSLSFEDLPPLGALVNASPGKVCVQGQECRTIAWTRTTLGKVEGGSRFSQDLSLPLSVQVLLGNPGTNNSPSPLLVPRDNGVVWVIFGLCAPNAHDCRNAVEVWTRVGSTPYVGPLLNRGS